MLQCSDVFGNAGGDWVGCIAGQELQPGNFAADPLWCDPLQNDFHVRSDSPCLPENRGEDGCGAIGAFGPVCITAARPATWTQVKSFYRGER